MIATIYFNELTVTPTTIMPSEEELRKKLTFERAISHERLKPAEFLYFLMPKEDLLALLAQVNELPETTVFHIQGSLVTSHLKDEMVDGFYVPTQWGFMRFQP